MRNRFAPLSGQRGLWVVVIVVAGLLVIALQQPAIVQLERSLAMRAEYAMRQALNIWPRPCERCRVFVIDDQAVEVFKTERFSLNSWLVFLEKLAKSKPSTIIIDSLFMAPMRASAAESADFVARVRALDVPLHVAVATSERPVYREFDASERPEFQSARFVNSTALHSYAAIQRNFVYGANPAFRAAFEQLGHIELSADTRIAPVLRVANDEHSVMVPHMALTLSRHIGVQRTYVDSDRSRIHLDDDGLVSLNIPDPEKFRSKLRNVLEITEHIAENGMDVPMPTVGSGDIVVILPGYFTGGTDFKTTPVGRHPGGMLLMAAIANYANGEFIVPTTWGVRLLLHIVVLGAVLWLTWALPTAFGVGVAAAGPVVFAALGFGALFYLHFSLPWLSLVGLSSVPPLMVVSMRWRLQANRAREVERAFAGALPSQQIEKVTSQSLQLNLAPRGADLTICFIDIVGFSLVAEMLHPDEVFESLKIRFERMRALIHQYGGFVDRSLGDGLLCYFGLDITGRDVVRDHAIQAVRCARALQEDSVRFNLQMMAAGSPIFPLRIGINTDFVCVGDLGSGGRIDFTIIGEGVNFASRLEGACDHHRLLLGRNTFKRLLRADRDELGPVRKEIQIKHYDQLFDAFEVSVAPELASDIHRLTQYHREQNGKKRVGDRLRWVRDAAMMETNRGAAALVDFSAGGMRLRLGRYLARGVSMTIEEFAQFPELNAALRATGVLPLHTQVRWSDVSSPQEFEHGVAFTNLNAEQSKMLSRELSRLSGQERRAVDRAS